MTTKEYVKKYELNINDKFNHTEFVSDLSSDFIVLLELNKAEDNIKGFDNALRALRMKFDAINNKTVGQIPEKLWSYFYATVVVKMRDEMCPKDMERRNAIKKEKRKEWEERKKQQAWEYDELFRGSSFYSRFMEMLNLIKQISLPNDSLIVLGITVDDNFDETLVNSKYRELVKKHHPDKGGKQEDFIRITEARNKCLNYLSNKITMEKYSKIIWDSDFGYELGLYIEPSKIIENCQHIYLLTGVVIGEISHQNKEVKEYSIELHEKLKTKYNRHKEFPNESVIKNIIYLLENSKPKENQTSIQYENNDVDNVINQKLNDNEYEAIVRSFDKDKGIVEIDEITVKSGRKIKYAPLSIGIFDKYFKIGEKVKLTMIGTVLPRISKFTYKPNVAIVCDDTDSLSSRAFSNIFKKAGIPEELIFINNLNEKIIQKTIGSFGFLRTSKTNKYNDNSEITLCYDKNIDSCYNKIELIFDINVVSKYESKTELKIIYHQTNIIKKVKYDGHCNNVKFLQALIENLKID